MCIRDSGDYVSQVLIPTEKVYQVRNGKKIVKERSYLPGYVLVEAALVGEVAHHLRNTPNVIGFLGGSETPVPLRQSEAVSYTHLKACQYVQLRSASAFREYRRC